MRTYPDYTEYLVASLAGRQDPRPMTGADTLAGIALFRAAECTGSRQALDCALEGIRSCAPYLLQKKAFTAGELLLGAAAATAPGEEFHDVTLRIKDVLLGEAPSLVSTSGEALTRLVFLSRLCKALRPGSAAREAFLLKQLDAMDLYGRGRLDELGLYGLYLSASDALNRRYLEYLGWLDGCLEMHEGLWFRLADDRSLPVESCDAVGSALALCAIYHALRLGGNEPADRRILASKVWRGVKHNIIVGDDGLLEVRQSPGLCLGKGDWQYLAAPEQRRGRGVLGAVLLSALAAEHGA